VEKLRTTRHLLGDDHKVAAKEAEVKLADLKQLPQGTKSRKLCLKAFESLLPDSGMNAIWAHAVNTEELRGVGFQLKSE